MKSKKQNQPSNPTHDILLVMTFMSGVVTFFSFFAFVLGWFSFVANVDIKGHVVAIKHSKVTTVEMYDGSTFEKFPLSDRRKNYKTLIDIKIGDVVTKDRNSSDIYINSELAVDRVSWAYFIMPFGIALFAFVSFSTILWLWSRHLRAHADKIAGEPPLPFAEPPGRG